MKMTKEEKTLRTMTKGKPGPLGAYYYPLITNRAISRLITAMRRAVTEQANETFIAERCSVCMGPDPCRRAK